MEGLRHRHPAAPTSDKGRAGFQHWYRWLHVGGGIGHLIRNCGLTCENLFSAELVTEDASVVLASESQESELLWAIRGGGGYFGVVRKFELALHEAGRSGAVALVACR